MKTTMLVVIVTCALILPTPLRLLAAPPEDPGVGFLMTSDHFSDPCTTDPGNIPRIYDNASSHVADVSFKVVNTGSTNLFITGTGFVIPPTGPNRRPRVMRVTLAPGASLGVQSQAGTCGWFATVRPH